MVHSPHSIRERDKIINYIKNQKEHHRKENSYDEYRRILEEHGIEYDENTLSDAFWISLGSAAGVAGSRIVSGDKKI